MNIHRLKVFSVGSSILTVSIIFSLIFQASFISNTAKMDIDIDDPDFWTKWAQKAAVDVKDIDKVRSNTCIDIGIRLFYKILH